MKDFLAGLTLTFVATSTVAAEKPIRFWNLATDTVTSIQLAPAGTNDFGANLMKGDADGAVDHDERLAIKNVAAGLYDAKIGFKGGRTCLVSALRLEAGSVFSIEDKDLSSCTP